MSAPITEQATTGRPTEVARARTHRWDDPVATAQDAMALSGLGALRAVRDGDLPAPPIATLIGFDLTVVEDGHVEFTLTPQEYHYNPIGSVHGGVFATLLDSAAGCAVHSTLTPGVGYTSQDLTVKFLRRLTVESGPVSCVGQVMHRGRTTALAEARLLDADGRLLAYATSSCLILG